MHCFKRCALALLVIAALLVGAGALWVKILPDVLASADEPRKADAIVVLGGDLSRLMDGADLYREGYAPLVLISNPRREERFEALEREGIDYPWFEQTGRELMRRRGIPDSAVIVFGYRLLSTVAEARIISAQHRQLKTILLVTSPYHIYRARKIFREHLPGVEIIAIGSRYDRFEPNWLRDPEMVRHAVMETLKLAFYVAGGRR